MLPPGTTGLRPHQPHRTRLNPLPLRPVLPSRLVLRSLNRAGRVHRPGAVPVPTVTVCTVTAPAVEQALVQGDHHDGGDKQRETDGDEGGLARDVGGGEAAEDRRGDEQGAPGQVLSAVPWAARPSPWLSHPSLWLGHRGASRGFGLLVAPAVADRLAVAGEDALARVDADDVGEAVDLAVALDRDGDGDGEMTRVCDGLGAGGTGTWCPGPPNTPRISTTTNDPHCAIASAPIRLMLEVIHIPVTLPTTACAAGRRTVPARSWPAGSS
jgi:hypothetical protein